jgi:hypothetical protein
MSRGGGSKWNFNKFNRGGGNIQQQRDKPLYTVPAGTSDDPNYNGAPGDQQQLTSNHSFTTDTEPGSFIGWKLYFPEKGLFLTFLNFPVLYIQIKFFFFSFQR